MTSTTHPELDGLGTYQFGWSDSDAAGAVAKRGLNEAAVRELSDKKSEPQGRHGHARAGAVAKRGLSGAVVRDIWDKKSGPHWMLDLRMKGLKLFPRKPMPAW